MNTYISAKKRILALIIIAILILAGAALVSSFSTESFKLTPQLVVGEYTLPVSMIEADGNTAHYYASGDMRFRYGHDEYGYILVEDNKGYLVYAENKDGYPTPSTVRYGADSRMVARASKMSYADIDFAANPSLISDWEGLSHSESSLLQSQTQATIVNIVIFIEFKNSTFYVPSDNFASLLTAEGNSLRDYYNKLTYGGIDFESAYPKTESQNVFVYKAPQNRNYYDVNKPSRSRYEREAVLLTDAIGAVSSKINTVGLNLDVDNDARIDSVTFIMSGSASSTWGGLLWPHAWDLFSANKDYNSGKSAKIGGIEVGKFNMQFENSINQGVLCHEMGHILGAPDLYHYDDSRNYAPVGKWDLMQSNTTTPQFMTTHMRQKYIGYIEEEQIRDIAYNGIYSLKPTISATPQDVLAYKILPENAHNEYFMLEYRNNSITGYDSMLPGSGLIVYRINTTAEEGNKNAKYRDKNNPDEVYVFRPNVYTSGTIEENSRNNLGKAYLAPNNPYFSSVGKSIDFSYPAYDNNIIYYSNGSNSGIVIEILAMNADTIEFNVRLSGEDTIEDTYFTSRVGLTSGAFVNSAEFSGVLAGVHFSNIDTSYLKSMRAELLDDGGNIIATNTLNLTSFYTSYNAGMRNFPIQFIVNDKNNSISSIFERGVFANFNQPHMVRLIAEDADGDEIDLGSTQISDASCSWQEVLSTKREIVPTLSASANETIGLRFDGSLVRSGGYDYSTFSNIIGISSAYGHSLLLTKGMKVISVSNASHPKLNVGDWKDIIAVSASKDNSYGVDLDGNIKAVGDNTYGQLGITAFSNVKDIKGGLAHAVALGSGGRVYGAGDNSSGQLNFANWSDIIAIDAGDTFTVALRAGGNVLVAGTIGSEESISLGWGDIVKIAAGPDYILALTKEGRVLSYPSGSNGKTATADLRDIIEFSAGESHSVFLRMDGEVFYKGESSNATHPLANLLTDNYIPLTSISLNATSKELELTQTFCLQATALPTSATYQKFDFISLNETIATVDSEGNISTHAEGEAVIRAVYRGDESIFAELILTVTNPILIEEISFDYAQRNIVIGDTNTLTVITTPSGATNRGGGVFTSSNTDIVEVDATTGEITGITLGSATITVTINDFGVQKSAECIITVIDSVESITILSPIEKTQYNYGENLILAGGAVAVITKTGEEYSLPITMDMLSGYNPYNLGEQVITVTIDQKSIAFTVWVNDYVIGLVILQSIKTEYEYGDALDTRGGKLALDYASGIKGESVAITTEMISGYDYHKFGLQELSLSYEGFELVIEVILLDPIANITADFVKTCYAYGEQIGENETFKITRKSGTVEYVDIIYAQLSGFNPFVIGFHKVYLTYEGMQATTNLQVSDSVEGIQLEGMTRQGSYVFYDNEYPLINIRAAFLSGGVFGVSTTSLDNLYGVYYYQNMPLAKADFTQEHLGSQIILELRIFAKERNSEGVIQEKQLNISEVSLVNIIEVADIEIIYQPTYNRSTVGNITDLGIKVKVIDVDGNISIEAADSISFIDFDIFELQEVTVSYLDFEKKISITLINDPVGLYCDDNLQIGYGADFSGSVYLVRFNGDRHILYADEYIIIGFDSYSLGEQEITIECVIEGYPFSYQITVYIFEDVAELELITSGVEEYKLGAEIDLNGREIVIVYQSGASRQVVFSNEIFTILPYDNNSVGSNTLTIVHISSGVSCGYDVYFLDFVISIRVDSQSKKVYEYGEKFSYSKTLVYKTFASGVEHIISEYNTNYDCSHLDRQTVRVTYYDALDTYFTAYFDVTVIDVVDKLELISPPAKDRYSYGEALDFTGLELRATYLSGAKVIITDAANLEVAYNPILTGTQSVQLLLEGKSVSFDVTIRRQNYAFLEYSSVDAKISSDKILFYESLFLPKIFDMIRLHDSFYYLDINLQSLQGQLIDTSLAQYENVYLSGNYRLLISNGAGEEIALYNICIYGDMNNDGVFDEGDLIVFGQALVEGDKGDQLDFDGNGSYDLIDFIGWVKAANKKVDPQPLMLFFRSLVAPPQKRYAL